MSTFFSALTMIALITGIVMAIQAARRKQKMSRNGKIAFGVAAASFLLTGATMTPEEWASNAKPTPQQEASQPQQAEQATELTGDTSEAASIDVETFMINCMDTVRNRLLPARVRFAPSEEMRKNPPLFGPENATFQSWIEAESSSGRVSRYSYSCNYTRSDNKLHWTLVPD